MSYRKPLGRVENYTKPFLAMTGVIVFMGLWTAASIWGFSVVVVFTVVTDLVLKRLAIRRR